MRSWFLMTTVLTALVLETLIVPPVRGFAQGATTTADAHRHRHQPITVDDRVQKLTEQVQLSPDQAAKVKTILQREHGRVYQLRTTSTLSAVDRFHAMREVHDKAADEVRGVLNDDQAKKYDLLHPRVKPSDATKHEDSGSPQ